MARCRAGKSELRMNRLLSALMASCARAWFNGHAPEFRRMPRQASLHPDPARLERPWPAGAALSGALACNAALSDRAALGETP